MNSSRNSTRLIVYLMVGIGLVSCTERRGDRPVGDGVAESEGPRVPQLPVSLADHADALPDSGEKWLRVEELADDSPGGWATGQFVPELNKLIIETDGVRQFVIAADRVDLDWDRRVVLRINGSNSELTRKHFPTIRLRQTVGGDWRPVTTDDPESAVR
jgi:hypothetical protein